MYRIILFFVVLGLTIGCGDKTASQANIKRAPNAGFDYKQFVETGGELPKVGEFVFFTMDIYDDRDSLLQKNTEQLNYPSIEVLPSEDINRKKNPMLDIISILAVGDSAAILLPADSIPGGLPPQMSYVKNLEYHVTIKDILTAEENTAKRLAAQEVAMARQKEVEDLTATTLESYKAGSLDLLTTPNGVKYHIHENGTGDLPQENQEVTMSYYGRSVSTGEKFDESFSRGRGYPFRLGTGAVIQGWHEAARYLPLGTRASIFIPAELGYGAQGSPPVIAPNAELYFYVIVDQILN